MKNIETIRSKIYVLRGQSVMLDFDLAELYGIETKALNQAVKRNANRFPHDFMFVLSAPEFENLRSQFVTAKITAKRRNLPAAFTEHGILMLSSSGKRNTAEIGKIWQAIHELYGNQGPVEPKKIGFKV